MREIRPSGSEGGGAPIPPPYPYLLLFLSATEKQEDSALRSEWQIRSCCRI